MAVRSDGLVMDSAPRVCYHQGTADHHGGEPDIMEAPASAGRRSRGRTKYQSLAKMPMRKQARLKNPSPVINSPRKLIVLSRAQ